MKNVKSTLATLTLTAIALLTLMSCSLATDVSVEGPQKLQATPKMEIAIDPRYINDVAEIAKQEPIRAAFRTIEDDRALNVAKLIELTEIPAPPFGEEQRALRVAEMMRELGLSDVRIDEVGNAVARRPGRTGARTVAMIAHIDTVFPIETDVTVRKEGDTYIAPGIGDNSRGVVLMLSMLKAMQENNIQTEDDMLFVGNVGEEGLGDLRGVKHLYRASAPKIDAMIAIDGGRQNRVVYGGVGSSRYRVAFKGPGGHSWGDFGDANPHHALGRAIALFSERAPDVTLHGPRTSFSVGRIGGGTSINSIAFESWMEVDMRSGSVDKLDDIDAIFLKAIQDGLTAENDARQRGSEISVEVKKVGERPAGKSDPRSPLVQQAMAAMQVIGLEPDLRISSTDANIPISMGLPAITLSRGGVGSGAHSFEEKWTDKDAHIAIQVALLTTLAQTGFVPPSQD